MDSISFIIPGGHNGCILYDTADTSPCSMFWPTNFHEIDFHTNSIYSQPKNIIHVLQQSKDTKFEG
jgi:hypothetical protein